MLIFCLCHDFQLVTQAVCTRASSTFTAEMDMAYSLMQETSDLFQAKEGKSSFANKENIQILLIPNFKMSLSQDGVVDLMDNNSLITGYMIPTGQFLKPPL